MPDGTTMKVTIAEYYTPNGICIDGVGIEPNKEVKDETKQIEEAVKIINNEK
jgi:carboxyl-terminal processing protease